MRGPDTDRVMTTLYFLKIFVLSLKLAYQVLSNAIFNYKNATKPFLIFDDLANMGHTWAVHLTSIFCYRSWARSMNHSIHPNVEVWPPHLLRVTSSSLPQLAMRACRDIQAGEELVWDYGVRTDQEGERLPWANCSVSTVDSGQINALTP